MAKRFSSLVLIAAALALAGLGHYYLLYQRIYIRDAVVFYVVAALLLVRAWWRAGATPDRRWALLQSALRRLGAALRGLLLRRSTRPLVVALAAANGLAALVAFLVPPPTGLLVALLLWAGGVAALMALIPWPRRARRARPRPTPEMPPEVPTEVREVPGPVMVTAEAVRPRQYAVPLAVAGWLLLVAGALVLALPGAPGPLEAIDDWLWPMLAELHVDAPLPPGVWFVGLVLSCIGMILVAWTRGGVDRLPGALSLGGETPSVQVVSRPSWRWLALALVGDLVWLGVVYAAAVSSTSWSVVPLWLATLAIQAVCWWRVDRARGVSSFPRLVIGHRPLVIGHWLLAIGLVVAFGVTLYRLGDVPNSLWGDEGAFWWWARDLAKDVRVDLFGLGVYGAFPVMGSLYQSLWVRLFGPTVWAWRLGSAVAGTLTLVPLFFLTRKLLGTRVAWSAVALMVSLPYFLAYARIGFNSIQPLLPITLGLWLLVEAAQRHSRTLAYLSGVACGMASLTYTSGHVGLVLVMLVWLFLFIRQRSLRRVLLGLALCLMMGWFLATGPFLLGCLLGSKPMGWKVAESFIGNAFYGEAMFSPDEITRLHPLWRLGEQRIFFEPRLYALLLGRGVVRTALSMVTDGIATMEYVVGPLAGPGTVFFLAGLAWALGQYRRLPAVLWTVWVLVCATLFSVLNTFPPRAAHMAPIIPALAVLLAVGIWLLSDLLRRFVRPRWADWVGVVLTVVLALWGLHTYFVEMPRRYVPNLENVMFWAAQKMDRGSNLVFVVDEPYPPEFRVWGIDEFDLGVEYHSVPAEEVQAADFRALCGMTTRPSHGEACRVFFLPESAGDVLAQLHAQLGEGMVRTHVNREGQPIGLEFVPLGLETGAPVSGQVEEEGYWWQPGLHWVAILLLVASAAVLLGRLVRLPVKGGTVVARSASSLRRWRPQPATHWPPWLAPTLLLAGLACAVVGQVCFAQDFLPGRSDQGPHFWSGMLFYAVSAACLLALTWAVRTTVGTPVLPTPAQLSSLPSRRLGVLEQRWRIGLLCGALLVGLALAWDLSHRAASASHALPFALWVLMMVAYLAAFVRLPSWKMSAWKKVLDWWRIHRVEVLSVLILAVVAFVLRAYAVDSIPYSLGGDEATQGVGALEFLEGTRTNMFAISDWYFYPNFGYFSLSLSLMLFGRTVTGLRMLAVLVGTLSVLLTYLLARRLLGMQAALIAAFFLAVQHYHLHFSRLGSINIFDTLFAPLLVYLLVSGLRKQRAGWFAAAGLTMGVAQYYYNGAKMLPFVVAALVGYLALARRDLLRANLTNIGILALGAVLAFIPLGLYEVAHPGSFAGRVSQVNTFQSGWLADEVLFSGKSVLHVLGEVVLRAFLAFSYFTDQSFWYYSSIPFLDSVSAVLFTLGLIVAVRHASRNVGYLLVATWFCLAVMTGGVLVANPPASERLIITTPALAILVALGLVQFVEYGRTLLPRLAPVWRVLPAVVTLALMFTNAGYYFLDYTPTHVYGNPTVEVMTRLLKDLAAHEDYDEDVKVYFFGAPVVFYESTMSRFLAPEIEGMDVEEDWTGDLGFVDTRRRALFVFLPGRLEELEVVRAAYPDGMETPIYSSANGQLLYVLYEVTPGG